MTKEKEPVVILGAGVAGLAAGYYLSRAGWPVTVVERGPVVGGLCASFQAEGFTLDYGPHKLYSVVPGILDEIRAILGDKLLEHRKKNRIRLLGRFLEYPLRLTNLLPLLGPVRATKLGVGYAAAMAKGIVGHPTPASYEDYILQRFGRGVYELVFEPLAWKVWGDPRKLSAELAEARIPGGGATDLILRLLKLKANTADVDAPFFYYPKGGFGVFPQRLAEEIRKNGGQVLTSATPVGIERGPDRIEAVEVETAEGRQRLACGTLVSSIPLAVLAKMLHPGSAEVEAEARALKLRDLILVFLVLDQPRVVDDHWIFFPEREYPFSRMFEQKAMDADMGPADQTVVCCDLTCDEGDATWTATDDELVQRCLKALTDAGLTTKDKLKTGFVRRQKSFYPMYTVDFRQKLRAVYDRLKVADNLLLTGRVGMFNYNNSDHCLDMGRFIAEGMGQGTAPREIWSGLEERVRSYRIVD